MRVLLAAGASMEATDGNGYTPLVAAAIYQAPEAVAALLAAGANKNVQYGGQYLLTYMRNNYGVSHKVVELLAAADASG